MTLETFKLGDIADVSWGDTKTTKASYVDSGYPAYSATGQDGYLDHFDYNEPGVVVSAIGAQCGKSWFASGKWSCIKNTIRILAKPGVSDARYLYYAACAPNFFPNRGSAQPFIAQSDARDIRINLPPLDEQRRIAGVMGALDDLIEVNRGLIADLNEMAAAQASRWIRSSDLKVRLSEVADHLAGKYLAKDKYAAGGQYVVHGSNSIMGTHSEFLHRGPLTVLARIGSFCGALAFSEDSAWINNNASAIRAKRSSEAYWLHRSLLSVDMDMHRAGSGQPFVRVESLMNTEIPWLSPEELESANRGLGTLEKAIAALQMENSQLASTRDELLPLLMSGRVRVSEDVAA